MKRRLKYPLIVEGKYDKATLSNLVEGEILLTDGFHIYKNKECFRFSGSWPKTARWRY